MSHETLWAKWKATDSYDYVSWLEAKYAAMEAEVASFRSAQQRKGETVRSCLTCGKFINCSTPLSNCGYDYWIPHPASPVA